MYFLMFIVNYEAMNVHTCTKYTVLLHTANSDFHPDKNLQGKVRTRLC